MTPKLALQLRRKIRALRFSFEIRRRHVVEQQVVVQSEELAEAPLQMYFEFALVWQQAIESTVKPRVVDGLRLDAEQVFQGGPPIPVLGDMQLTRRLAEPCENEGQHHIRPRDHLSSPWKNVCAQPVKLESLPAQPAKPDVTESAAPLDTDPFQVDGHGVERTAILEKIELVGALAEEVLGNSRRIRATFGVELTEIRDGFLTNLTSLAHRAHESPVRVGLSALANGRMAQLHFSTLLRSLSPRRTSAATR